MSDDEGASQELENQIGTVGFWIPLHRFLISFPNPDTYDGLYTCILNGDMPEQFRTQGMRVVFSGRIYRDESTPHPQLGGQQTFWLSLREIRRG